MRCAVIGAGAAGLASARHAVKEGFQCQVFEMLSELGGVWVYNNDTHEDQYGFPVYSAMYKGLRTNLPKEVMGFPDFPIPDRDHSYLTQNEILEFLNLYADHFHLRDLIKFNRMVTEIRPLDDHKWQISSIDKPTKTIHIDVFDSVMVCNGHYNQPVVPTIEGQNRFQGRIYHSREYRTPDVFFDQKLLLVGAGPSGVDLALQLSKFAKYVTLSHHRDIVGEIKYPENVNKKSDIRKIIDHETIEFTDGTRSKFDVIIFCTGYKYSFPFLHQSCGITENGYYIQPLYKHMIHIEKPTMCFIGIPFNVCAFQMFDLQARVFCKYMKMPELLPSNEEMYRHTKADMNDRWARGYTNRKAHMMGEYQQQYYQDLASAVGTTPIPPVIVKLRDHSVQLLYEDLQNFRNNRYRIIDNESFITVN